MNRMPQKIVCAFRILLVCLCFTVPVSCNFLKKKATPTDLFKLAEQDRKNEKFVEAARKYDELVKEYEQSELLPTALYYSGICKYTLSLRAPGKRAFEQRKGGLSETKQALYASWLDFMVDQDEQFLYIDAVDTFLYTGTEFKQLLDQFPASNLADDAAFQLIHTHINAKGKTNTLTAEIALQLYTEYFTEYPQSPYRAKGLEHLREVVAQYAETILNHEEIATTYHQLAEAVDHVPELDKLAYFIAERFLAVKDMKNAARMLNVPSILGVGIVETASTRLNIRSGQGTQYRIVGKAEKGQRVLLLSKSGHWYQIRLEDGTLGYTHADFIQVSQP